MPVSTIRRVEPNSSYRFVEREDIVPGAEIFAVERAYIERDKTYPPHRIRLDDQPIRNIMSGGEIVPYVFFHCIGLQWQPEGIRYVPLTEFLGELDDETGTSRGELVYWVGIDS